MIALFASLGAALIAAVLAPWAKDRIAGRRVERLTLAQSVDVRLQDLIETYRGDLADVRSRLAAAELEISEWRSGIHGVPGVWVAVPAHIWQMVRASLPSLPATRFPGEPEINGETDDDGDAG